MSAPVNCVCLHPNQAELIVGDQSGVIHLWDLRSDHNEQLVRNENSFFFYSNGNVLTSIAHVLIQTIALYV